MMRFIIVEGNECTGKTTLVEELRGRLEARGWDAKSLVHRPGDQFYRYLLEYATADRVIFNRSHYAELVFSRLYRDGHAFSDPQAQVLDTIVAAYGLVVYCDLSVEVAEARLRARNSAEVLNTDDTSPEALRTAAAAFEAVFENREVLRYSACTPDNLIAVLDRVERLVLSA